MERNPLNEIYEKLQNGQPPMLNLAEVATEYTSTSITTEIQSGSIRFTLQGLRSNGSLDTLRYVVDLRDVIMYLSPP